MAVGMRGELAQTVTLHADRGCQYTSAQLARFADRHNLARSVGRTGQCWDNAAAESFWATLKVEFYDRYLWPTRTAARLAVGDWIEWVYNRRTPLGPRYDQPSRIREKIHSNGTSRLTLCLPNGVKPSETRLAVGIWRLGIAGRLLPLTTLGAWHCRKGADLVTLGTRSPRGPQRPDHASTPVLSPASSRSRPARPRPVADDASGIDSPASAAKDQARRT